MPAEPQVFLNQAPFSFDLSVFELTIALVSGGTVFALTRDFATDHAALISALAVLDIDVWVSTPSFAEFCLKSRNFSAKSIGAVGHFLFCGEVLLADTAKQLYERFPSTVVVNSFGPTETTVAVTSVEVSSEQASLGVPLPVGYVKDDTQIVISDSDEQPGKALPRGVQGEIVIVGPTVANGYYGRAELSAERFFEYQPANDGDARVYRAYRTGDLGVLDQEGMLWYKGRIDFQVKLHGYRIELGEIEQHLRALPSVADAVVLPVYRNDKASHLVACVLSTSVPDNYSSVVAQPAQPLSDFQRGLALKQSLANVLPSYMIPKLFRFFEVLPLNANGKLDRQKLSIIVSTGS